MLKEFVVTTQYIHASRLSDYESRAMQEADRREARAASRPIRQALGLRLIAIGERLADTLSSEKEPLEEAA